MIQIEKKQKLLQLKAIEDQNRKFQAQILQRMSTKQFRSSHSNQSKKLLSISKLLNKQRKDLINKNIKSLRQLKKQYFLTFKKQKDQIQKLTQEVQQLNQKNEKSEKEQKALIDYASKYNLQIQQSKQEIQIRTNKNKELTSLNQSLSEQSKYLQEEVEHVKNKRRNDKEEIIVHLQKERKKKENFYEQNQSLKIIEKRKESEIKNYQQEIVKLKTIVGFKDQDINNLRMKLRKKEEKIMEMNESKEEESLKNGEQLEELRSKITLINIECESQKRNASLKESRIKELEKVNKQEENYQKELEQLLSKVVTLQSQLEVSRKNNSMKDSRLQQLQKVKEESTTFQRSTEFLRQLLKQKQERIAILQTRQKCSQVSGQESPSSTPKSSYHYLISKIKEAAYFQAQSFTDEQNDKEKVILKLHQLLMEQNRKTNFEKKKFSDQQIKFSIEIQNKQKVISNLQSQINEIYKVKNSLNQQLRRKDEQIFLLEKKLSKVQTYCEIPREAVFNEQQDSSIDSIDEKIKPKARQVYEKNTTNSHLIEDDSFIKQLNRFSSDSSLPQNQVSAQAFDNSQQIISKKIVNFSLKNSVISRLNSSKFFPTFQSKKSFLILYSCVLESYFSKKLCSSLREQILMSDSITISKINETDMNPQFFERSDEKSIFSSPDANITKQSSIHHQKEEQQTHDMKEGKESINESLKKFNKIQKQLKQVKSHINFTQKVDQITQNQLFFSQLHRLKNNEVAKMIILLIKENKVVKKCLDQMIQNEQALQQANNDSYFEKKETQISFMQNSFRSGDESEKIQFSETTKQKKQQNCNIF